METITIKEYLIRKGINFWERNSELITHCLFNGCDDDSKGKEAHLYFDMETSRYNCKKCGESGNIITLAKHLGDPLKDIASYQPGPAKEEKIRIPRFNAALVESCHRALPTNIRNYLNARGISDFVISESKLGWGEFYGKWWITIPITDIYCNYTYFKLRQDPTKGDEKITYPAGKEAQIYNRDILISGHQGIVICEGELDCLLLASNKVPAISSTHGAMTFKDEWLEKLAKYPKIYICFDNDEAGRKGVKRIADMLNKKGHRGIYIVTLPTEVGAGGDITDYAIKLKGNLYDLFDKYAKEYPEKIDTSQFKPLYSKDLIHILGQTIKKDDDNKVATFLCQLSAFTEDSQFNIIFNAPSSTGKSYIPLEIAQLFPQEDIIIMGYCSPTAFYHDVGEYNKERKGYEIDLSRKILIFLDQPHMQLLERLRPFFSHDRKEIHIKITDKSQKFGLKTKDVYLKGFPSVIFCSAKFKIDEQECTRNILLSPHTTQDKLKEGIITRIKKDCNRYEFKYSVDNNPERMLLKERIKAIRNKFIEDVIISNPAYIEKVFLSKKTYLKPRHQRDAGRFIDIIKSFALLNFMFRERKGNLLIADIKDVEEAIKIWDNISESQDYGLSPYAYQLFKEIITPAYEKKNKENINFEKLGISRQEISKMHYELYGRLLPDWQLRQDILPALETAGLITQDIDPNGSRKKLVYPTLLLTVSDNSNCELYGGVDSNNEQSNCESDCGVN